LDDDVRAAARGDARAFARLVERCAVRCHAVARRIAGRDAEDVVQEAFTRAYLVLREGRYPAGAPFDRWVVRVVVNHAIDVVRARPRGRFADASLLDELAAPEDAAARTRARQLLSALEQLSAEQRAALVLREVEGYTLAETAAILGTTEGAIEQRVLRAWAALRRRLTDG
jgi:RNA polymerase sigma-70 factor (ECF subfamily)